MCSSFSRIPTYSTTLNWAKPSFAWTVNDSQLVSLHLWWLPFLLFSIMQTEGCFLKSNMIMVQPEKACHGSQDRAAISKDCDPTPMYSSAAVSSSRYSFMLGFHNPGLSLVLLLTTQHPLLAAAGACAWSTLPPPFIYLKSHPPRVRH